MTTRTKPRVAGIDPGNTTAVAWRDERGRWKVQTVCTKGKSSFAASFDERLRTVLMDAKVDGIASVAIEDAYYNKLNPKTFRVQCKKIDDIVRMCEGVGLNATLVAASTWQAGWKIGGRTSRDERKLGSKRIAKILGATPKHDHEADAVLIAEYASCNSQNQPKGDTSCHKKP